MPVVMGNGDGNVNMFKKPLNKFVDNRHIDSKRNMQSNIPNLKLGEVRVMACRMEFFTLFSQIAVHRLLKS